MELLEFKQIEAKDDEFCCSSCGEIFHESCAHMLHDEYLCYDCKELILDNIIQANWEQETLQELRYWSLGI